MNIINKRPVGDLGYDFIAADFLPPGQDEYYLRNAQNKNGVHYRSLTRTEIEVLERNRNASDNWNKVLVSDAFNPELVKNCQFHGLVRIGKLEPYYLEFHNLRMPVGLYNSTIISCDLGDNVVIDNVSYISHYIIGNEVIIVNVNEIACTDHAKFGNGVVKEGEQEKVRIWLEVCNENGGRSILPFNGMLPGDAWLWSRYRANEGLQSKLKEFTDNRYDLRRGFYGEVGDRSIIKNTRIIKDVWIGTDAYIKGANKLKNLTINSSPQAKSQIGEGCELVNGIIGYGCRIFYGVKAVRFVLNDNSQLKYGARLINSYLGYNSTISCCEVLNSLIFPAHEQHHNNSFLCAALVMGQSNMAAGATIGSNHNSRSPDGELIAGRGFWPGLCVSLKHNSKFASFCILAKGDYPYELNIPIPFSLISNDQSRNELVIMPAYWFLYNMYALARNSWKYGDRDKRTDKTQLIDFDFLAPDSINEIIHGMELMERFTAKAYLRKTGETFTGGNRDLALLGERLLEKEDLLFYDLEIIAEGFENNHRVIRLVKVKESYRVFREIVNYYTVQQVLGYATENQLTSFAALQESLPSGHPLEEWVNAGGQLIRKTEMDRLIDEVSNGNANSWEHIHEFYKQQSAAYAKDKLAHSIAAFEEVFGISLKTAGTAIFKDLLQRAAHTKEWMTAGISESRAKDYQNPFRMMVYESEQEMEKVLGSFESNSFIKQEVENLQSFKQEVSNWIENLKNN
ncbi:MAG TPA: DUF4954 family protein [Chitinophagaceae bacterium]|nr:DUF4954 family protein [Chitinophagaceae bacterium]